MFSIDSYIIHIRRVVELKNDSKLYKVEAYLQYSLRNRVRYLKK